MSFFLTYTAILFIIIFPVFSADTIVIPYSINQFDICKEAPKAWTYIKIAYVFLHFFSAIIIANSIYNLFVKNHTVKKANKAPIENDSSPDGISLYLGNSSITGEKFYIPEKGLYQNILITGTIGSGKTSGAMYPFTKQLIQYRSFNNNKLGMLILDVKGNFYKQVKLYAKQFSRLDDLIIIELGKTVRYNPLDKPNLKPIVLAHRLKTILELFSGSNTESYWLDKAEQVLTESIKLCRLYNHGYVTFTELHKLINTEGYYKEKLTYLRDLFQSGGLSDEEIYNLSSSITFFEDEFMALDSRTLSILKSEITRITGTFVSDLNILNTFCPNKEDITFFGFEEVIHSGKIIVLNMNIAEYKNLSKIIAAYLKLDFQSEVLLQLSNDASPPNPTVFICDEFHEYVTSTDGDFFAQSREAKCINIVATQSYTSLLKTLGNESSVRVIVQNLINKLWFRTDDSFSIEDIQKQIGKEEKSRSTKSVSENANETHYSYFTNSLKSKKSNVSESISSSVYSDFVYDTNFFTQDLEVFTCLSFISDGDKIMKPAKLNMIPYFLECNDIAPKDKNNYKII